MNLNLETLRDEILAAIESAGFPVYYSRPDDLRPHPMVLWDVERHPDYQMFLEVARKAGAKMILFAAAPFEASYIDELEEQVKDADLPRDEQREYESRLRKFRSYDGRIFSIEVAFHHESYFCVYNVQPDWYDEFSELEEEIRTTLPDADEDEEDDNLGGYFSRN